MKIKPLGNRVLARKLAPPEKSASGRLFLLTSKDAHSVRFAIQRFVVLAPEQGLQNSETGEWFRTTGLAAGDVIQTGMYPGSSYRDDDVGEVWFLPVGNCTVQEIADSDPLGKRSGEVIVDAAGNVYPAIPPNDKPIGKIKEWRSE